MEHLSIPQHQLQFEDRVFDDASWIHQQQHQAPVAEHLLVMTEEQLETLRRQISVYATICQQLAEQQKATLNEQHLQQQQQHCFFNAAGLHDPRATIMMHKSSSRQRWTPSQNQLHILERLFKQGNGTPNRQRIKEITSELSQHGQISETNVYNWFQNRKARAKRKQRHLVSSAAQLQQQQQKQLKHTEAECSSPNDNSKSRFSEELEGSSSEVSPQQQQYSVVVYNGKAWKVKPGRLNVWSNFGDKATLLDPRGQLFPIDECGMTCQPLQPGAAYTVAGTGLSDGTLDCVC
uniref:Wuschel-like homeobox 13B n=1 Tax=Selaginella kraussiana TaxID=81964 RepID=A0A0N7J6J3_9TRAC|nr:wuschel-like homeobox 13B [Selaginella kraussiana]